MSLAAIDLGPTLPAPSSQSFARRTPLQAGTVVADRYVVGAVLGQGAMGIVYAARDRHLARRVAIKVLRPELASDPMLLERFANEARITASLSSPHIATVFDTGRLSTGEPFLVIEWLDGEPLHRVLARRGRLPVREAVDLVIDACSGLVEAHAAGIVHRDIKPSNLLICTDRGGKTLLKILDFGISKRLTSQPNLGLTRAGDSLGSPHYMSPEQATNSADVDARSDVWSLGVVLFELISGRPPFEGDSIAEVFAKILGDPAPSLCALAPDVDRELEGVVWRCLAKEPAHRFKNAEGLRHALMLYGSEGAHSGVWTRLAMDEDPLPEIPKHSQRGAWLGLGVAVSAVLIAVYTLFGPSPVRLEAWFEGHSSPALLSTLDDDESKPLVFEPRIELPRGVYGALRAEPELEAAPPVPEATGDSDGYQGYLRNQGLVPVDQVWVKEKRVYDPSGRLIDVESEVIEPNDTQP